MMCSRFRSIAVSPPRPSSSSSIALTLLATAFVPPLPSRCVSNHRCRRHLPPLVLPPSRSLAFSSVSSPFLLDRVGSLSRQPSPWATSLHQPCQPLTSVCVPLYLLVVWSRPATTILSGKPGKPVPVRTASVWHEFGSGRRLI